jgi:hypothetical protein
MLCALQNATPADWANALAAWGALVLSVALAILRFLEKRRESNTRAQLKLVMTQDAFVRYGASGEVLFLNLVLIGSKRSALVVDISMELQRVTDRGEIIARLPLRLLRLGVPRDRGGPIHDHFFFSSSPIDLIPANTPERRVLMCAVAESDETIGSAIKKFESDVLAAAASTNDPQDFTTRSTRASGELVESVVRRASVLNGSYRIKMAITYSDSEFGAKKFTCDGSLTMNVRRSGENELVAKLRVYARDFTWTAVNPKGQYQYPETAFDDVQPRSV